MDQEKTGIALAGVGAILVAIFAFKFFVTGVYDSEIVPFGIVGAVGAGLCWGGSKVFTSARNKGA